MTVSKTKELKKMLLGMLRENRYVSFFVSPPSIASGSLFSADLELVTVRFCLCAHPY